MKTYEYTADCGSLAIRCDKSTIQLPNGIGDGYFKVTIRTNEERGPRGRFVASMKLENAELLDYDCGDGAKVLETLTGYYIVEALDNGNMVLTKLF
jgi:hypothetical protein